MNKSKKKSLLVLDLDFTILSENSDYSILNLLSKDSFDDLEKIRQKSTNWAHHMQQVYLKMKKENISIEKIKELVENIKFNPGFEELFQFIKTNQSSLDTMIISGANTLFLKWILEKNNLTEIFPTFYSNIAFEDEDCVIKIEPYHEHNCSNCDDSQCKRILLWNHLNGNLEKYENIFFAGDGENDYCLGTILRECDILFPRNKFPLYKKLFERDYIKNLSCIVHVWDDGNKIKQEISNSI